MSNIHSKEYQEIIQRLVQARLDANLTQEEAAKKIKKAQSYISKIENCERRLDILEAKWLCEMYEVTLASISG